MGSRAQESSDTSTEESDRQEQVKEDATTTDVNTNRNKRSYECNFCKRGFTNAQALGGHMNIHRKDRAKTRQVTPSSSSISTKTNEEYMNPDFTRSISSEPIYQYQVLESQRNYPVHFQPSGSSSPWQQMPKGYFIHGSHHFLASRNHRSLNMNEELWGASLSLRIESNHLDEVSKDDEVDLELRLGHHDRYR